MDLTVNAAMVASSVAFGGTGNWDTWQTVTIPVTLTAGTNKIKATATTANGGPNVDKITV
jgi:exo-1,4-beta-D-glucosaminidase